MLGAAALSADSARTGGGQTPPRGGGHHPRAARGPPAGAEALWATLLAEACLSTFDVCWLADPEERLTIVDRAGLWAESQVRDRGPLRRRPAQIS